MALNRDVQMTLEEAVDEVLGLLTGLDVSYLPEQDRFRSITRSLNRGLRSVALEHDWSYYTGDEEVAQVTPGVQEVEIPANLRPRVSLDDAVRLVTDGGTTVKWAYFLPREAVHKYQGRNGLWVSSTRNLLTFSRPFRLIEAGLHIVMPAMREPKMFELPPNGESEVPERVLRQQVDFDYPDLVVLRAAYFYAQTDPVMQPRVQTLEAQYKDAMYQLVERDTNFTDSPYLNEFTVPITNSIHGSSFPDARHQHPHSDERWW